MGGGGGKNSFCPPPNFLGGGGNCPLCPPPPPPPLPAPLGGVAYYIHNSISFRLRDDVCINGTEDLFIEVERQHSKNIIIGLVYRPPNRQFQYFYENLETSLNKLSLENKDMYLMGDFNINISDTSNQYVIKFLDLLASHALFPSIDKPTRITQDSLTLIDNIFCQCNK